MNKHLRFSSRLITFLIGNTQGDFEEEIIFDINILYVLPVRMHFKAKETLENESRLETNLAT